MGVKNVILKEIEKFPEQKLKKLLDYILILKDDELKENVGTAIASESSLKKDWLKKEEDEAWINL